MLQRPRIHNHLTGSLKPKALVNEHSDTSIYKISDHIDEPPPLIDSASLSLKISAWGSTRSVFLPASQKKDQT